jgi:hypothetical protein
MPEEGIPLRIVEFRDRDYLEPGMMWRYPSGDTPDRKCWWIVLPNTKPLLPGYASQIAWMTTDRASKPPHEMWEVTGEAPNLTVSPSIDVECWVMKDGEPVREGSYWHGWIKNGILINA